MIGKQLAIIIIIIHENWISKSLVIYCYKTGKYDW